MDRLRAARGTYAGRFENETRWKTRPVESDFRRENRSVHAPIIPLDYHRVNVTEPHRAPRGELLRVVGISMPHRGNADAHRVYRSVVYMYVCVYIFFLFFCTQKLTVRSLRSNARVSVSKVAKRKIRRPRFFLPVVHSTD